MGRAYSQVRITQYLCVNAYSERVALSTARISTVTTHTVRFTKESNRHWCRSPPVLVCRVKGGGDEEKVRQNNYNTLCDNSFSVDALVLKYRRRPIAEL